MSTLKKRQHYVWRHYLRAWANNEKIWTLLKEKKKIVNPNLMGVAQEKYFYELIDFTNEEELFLEKLITEMSHPSVKNLNMDFLKLFTSHYKLKKYLLDSKISDSNKQIIELEIKNLQVNLMEDAHSKMEGLGTKIIGCANSLDFEFLENDDDFFETIMFLCFQYARTKKMKKSIEKSFENNKTFEMKKFWNIISYAFATTFARNLSFNPNIKFLFYENNTNIKFVTGDQPIINILSDIVNDDGNTSGFEWYYPLSPKLALTVHLRDTQIINIESMPISEKQVDYFNQKMIEYSEEFIFSNAKEQLELIGI